MKKHKIRNVDLNVCCAEQKIAYNYLFSYNDVFKGAGKYDTLEIIKKHMDGSLKMEKYNKDLILSIICKNIESYSKRPFISSSYEEVGEKLPLPTVEPKYEVVGNRVLTSYETDENDIPLTYRECGIEGCPFSIEGKCVSPSCIQLNTHEEEE